MAASDLNRRIDGIVFPNLVSSFLNRAQQLILTELGVVKQKRAKILLHEPNYVQLRAWGKTRVCLALCFLDVHKNQQKGARYLIVTDSDFCSEQWVQEWNAYSRWCGGSLNTRAELTSCKTFNDVIDWHCACSSPSKADKAQFIIVSRAIISSDRVTDILRGTIWAMCLLDATIPNNFSLRTCCFIIVKHFRRDQNYNQLVPQTTSTPTQTVEPIETPPSPQLDRLVPALQSGRLELAQPQYRFIDDGLWEFVNNIVAARPLEQTTGLGLEKSLPDYFQYDPTPHLLVMLGRNVVFNTVNEIKKILPPYSQRYEFGEVARNLQIQTNMPLVYRIEENNSKQARCEKEHDSSICLTQDEKLSVYSASVPSASASSQATSSSTSSTSFASFDPFVFSHDTFKKTLETEQEKEQETEQETEQEKEQEQHECSVCYEKINDPTQIVTLQCCSAPCICSACFYKHLFLTFPKGPTKCIFCTKKIKYTLHECRPADKSREHRQPVPLHRQLAALRLLYELREKICETNFNFLILIHKNIVQQYFANLKRFSQTMKAFSAEPIYFMRAGDSEIPLVASQSNLVFVYEKPDDIFDFFVDKKLLTIGLVAHIRPIQDANPIDESFFERLCATRIRNVRLIISKIFIE